MQRSFIISLSQEYYSEKVCLSQYDSDYDLNFEVLDKGAKAPINGMTAYFEGTRCDGLSFRYTGTASDNYVSFTIDTALTAVSGRHTGEIVLYDGSGLWFGSANVQILVEKAARPDNAVDADVQEARSIAEQIQEIVDTAAEAAVDESVQNWLDEHPEATTTVQDGSITKDKLQASLKNEIETNTSDVSDLKSEVYAPFITDYLVSSYLQNAYIDTAHNVGDTINKTPISYNGWACIVIPCEQDDLFRISGQGNAGTPSYCWLDSDNKIVSKNTSTTIFENEEITAPKSGYLVLNTRMSVSYGAQKIGEDNPILESFGYVTPEMFGAKGDGVEDDTTAVQVAIDSGKCVYLANHYAISHGLLLKSNTVIDGLNTGKISKISSNLKYSAFYYYGASIQNVIIKNISIEGLKQWTGQSLSGHANDFGIRIENAKDVTISNNIVSDFGGAGISVVGENCKIINNTVTYTGEFTGDVPNYNFGIDYKGTDFIISNNIISGVIQGIISGLTNKNIVISENNISTNGQHGLYMEGADNVNVIGNVIHDCSLCGIKFQLGHSDIVKYEKITIADNTIESCGKQGIMIVDIPKLYILSNVIISSNNIKDVQRGIELTACKKIQVTGNIIDISSGGEYGIIVSNIDDVSISDNRISLENCNCIFFENDSSLTHYKNILVKDNHIYLTNTTVKSDFGLRIASGGNVFIEGNMLIGGENTGNSDGIYLPADDGDIISLYLINNISKGFRWDIRALTRTGITISGNYYNTITGITQS